LLKDLQHRGLADQREFIVSDKALRVVKTDINHLVAELAEVSKKRALSLVGVDPAAVSKQTLTERKSRLENIEGLIEALAGKTEEATKAVGGLPAST
jgi:predicted transcriptional regulator